MSNNQDLEELNRKVDILVKLMAYQIVGKLTITEGAPLLRRLGLTAGEIANIYDSNSKAVNVRLSEARKKSSSRKPAAEE